MSQSKLYAASGVAARKTSCAMCKGVIHPGDPYQKVGMRYGRLPQERTFCLICAAKERVAWREDPEAMAWNMESEAVLKILRDRHGMPWLMDKIRLAMSDFKEEAETNTKEVRQ